jgi:hypothetical protein
LDEASAQGFHLLPHKLTRPIRLVDLNLTAELAPAHKNHCQEKSVADFNAAVKLAYVENG